MIIRPEAVFRLKAIIGMIAAAIVGVAVLVSPFSSRGSIKRIIFALALVVFMVSLVYALFPTPAARRDAQYEFTKRFALFRGSNVLNFYANSYPDHTKTLSLDAIDNGVVITSFQNTDLHIAVSETSHYFINDIGFYFELLQKLVTRRRERLDSFRIFLWIDRNASMECRSELLDFLIETQHRPLYIVGIEKTSAGHSQYVATELDVNGESP